MTNHVEILIQVFLPSLFAFIVGILISFPIIKWLKQNQIWKKKNVSLSTDGHSTPLSASIHNDEEKKLLRMGGSIMLFSTLITAFVFWIPTQFSFDDIWETLDFVSRSQTWIPLFVFFVGGILGAIDDLLVVEYIKSKSLAKGGGLSLRKRFMIIIPVVIFISWWLVYKIDLNVLHIPFVGNYELPLIIMFLLAIFMFIATYLGSVIDGVDGLSGGVFVFIYSAFGAIAIIKNSFDIAAFCFVVVAGLLAFLWHNIYPARVMNAEIGMTPLLLGITAIAFLLKAPLLLIVSGLLIYITIASSTLQILSKKFLHKKLFLIAPLHNNLILKGWSHPQVTMRYWIVSYFLCIITVLFSLF
jgi:phospho-N-acetylmuramoyl-pentapeptide-transferase